ncbi:hypothetical protein ACBG85_29905 (plasmid) [Rhodococcus sp. NyZ502]|jgi:hypothetical protein|uniref:hypothetical protein n=1 Tax=Rhodococcus TaxID=1827 RepID=UPI0011C1A527|nr:MULTISPECIES: hypothetical protein [Rhodococcus]MEA1798753.1 hypothetical protein [Rhodococcus qingshengii]
MRQDSISVMTVPATDETTAALTDWLLRELLPLMFAGAGLRRPASTLRKLPSVTARRIRSPWRLRFHTRALRTAIGAAEARLADNYAGAIEDPTHGSAGVAVPPARVMPEQVMDAVARLSGDLDESGCEIASLANRALFAAGAVIGTGRGDLSTPDAYYAVRDSYCGVLALLWSTDLEVHVQLRNR